MNKKKSKPRRRGPNLGPTKAPFKATPSWVSGMQIVWGKWPRCAMCRELFDFEDNVIWTASESVGGEPVHYECFVQNESKGAM